MDEYLDLLKVYYNEKQIFLTKGKHKKCLECEHDKQFIETGGELIFSCGDVKSNKSKCGNKIRIELPIYKSEKDLTYFKNSLQKTINWEVIGKYIDVNSKGKDDNIALKKKYDDELKSIKGLFNKYNLKNTELIKDNYKKITKLKNESKIILTEMKLIENKSKMPLLKKQYIENLNNIQTLNSEIRDLNDNIEYYFMTDEPKLPAKDYNPGIIDSKQNKKKVKDKVEVIDDTFKEGDEVKWLSGNKELKGKIDNITSKSYMICCKPDGKMYRVKKELVSLNKEEPVETVEEPQADVIYYFSKSKDTKWLSTFNRGNSFEYNDLIYPTVEHAFHAQKLDPNDDKLEEYQKLFTDENLEPNEAKKLGGRKNFEKNGYKLRNDWNDKRLEIMKECTESYYKQNKEMLNRLIETGDKKLIHKGFRIDDFWGVNKNGGNNHHGKILMKLREKFSKIEGVPQADAPAEKSLEPVEITIGSKVKWTKDGKDLNGEIESITSKSYIICCKPDGKLYRIKKELVSLNDLPESEAPDVEDDVEDEPAPDIEDDAPPDVEDVEVEQDEPPVEDKELVIGSKVKWIKNKKTLEGVIEKITQKSIIVCCKSAKINYRLPIDTKFI